MDIPTSSGRLWKAPKKVPKALKLRWTEFCARSSIYYSGCISSVGNIKWRNAMRIPILFDPLVNSVLLLPNSSHKVFTDKDDLDWFHSNMFPSKRASKKEAKEWLVKHDFVSLTEALGLFIGECEKQLRPGEVIKKAGKLEPWEKRKKHGPKDYEWYRKVPSHMVKAISALSVSFSFLLF